MSAFGEAMGRALNNPKYNILTGRAPDLRERAAGVAAELFERYVLPLLMRIPRFTDGNAGVKILYAVFILAGAAIISLIIYFAAARKKRAARNRPLPEIFEGVEVKRATPESMMKSSALFADGGNYREAVRRIYIALLLSLGRRGFVSLSDSKTNGQLAREIKKSAPGYYSRFTRAAGFFERAWFGNKYTDAEAYGEYLAEIQGFINAPAENINESGAAFA